MIDPKAIEKIKAEWQMLFGSDKSGKGAICPMCGSGSGKNGTGLSLVPKTNGVLKCFACGASGDAIKLIEQKYGYDFEKAVEYAGAQLCMSDAEIYIDNKKAKTKSSSKPVKGTNKPADKKPVDKKRLVLKKNTDDLKACIEMMKWIVDRHKAFLMSEEAPEYMANRGLSQATCEHFAIGYEQAWRHPSWAANCPKSPRIIIRTGNLSYLARDIRPLNELDEFGRDKMKVKVGEQGVFNRAAFSSEILFIVEGEIDAMSIYEVGFPNVAALGSISYINKFINALGIDLYYKKIERMPRAAIVALDNETTPQVQKAKAQLMGQLNELGIATLDGSTISGDCKDANDLLIKNRAELKENCRRLEEEARRLPELKMQTELVLESEQPTEEDKRKEEQAAGLLLTGTYTTRKVLGNCPIDLLIPDECAMTPEGIMMEETVASRNVILPVSLIVNHQTKEQQFELALSNVHGEWEYLTADAQTIFDASRILELTNRGVRTHSGKASKALVKYLFDMISLNESALPVKEEYDQPGWDSECREFRAPYYEQYYMPKLAEIYGTGGELTEWIEASKVMSVSAIARLMMGCAFSAPLMRILGQRTFGLYLHGTSKVGKSAIQKFAISAFGNPTKMMGTFNATMNGIEALCTRSNDMPLLIDESTVASPYFSMEKLAYITSSEQNRIRMDKTLTQRPMKHWRLPLMMNGEGRLLDEVSREGAMNRTLEIALEPDETVFKNEMASRKIHKFVEENHGHAGRAFLDELMKNREGKLNDSENDYEGIEYAIVKKYYNTLFEKAKEEYSAKYGLEQCALMALMGAGYGLMMKWLWCEPDDEENIVKAYNGVIDSNIKRLTTLNEMDEARRAWKHLIETLQSRRNNFLGEHMFKDNGEKRFNLSTPVYGELYYERISGAAIEEEEDKLVLSEARVLPVIAKQILSEKGFNATKMLKEFGHRGWILTEKDGRLMRRVWRGSDNKAQRMVIIEGEKYAPEV